MSVGYAVGRGKNFKFNIKASKVYRADIDSKKPTRSVIALEASQHP